IVSVDHFRFLSARKKRKEIAFYRLLGSPMTSALQFGEPAFVEPTHSTQLSDFQYVENTDLADSVATVKIVGPDDDKSSDTFDILINFTGIGNRTSFLAGVIRRPHCGLHKDITNRSRRMGIWRCVWVYSVQTTNILHIVSHDGPTRFKLTNTQSLINVDALIYALQPGQASCRKRWSGLSPSVLASLSIPFSPDEIIPLVIPATLQLVHVRRQHIANYSTASRKNQLLEKALMRPKTLRHLAATLALSTRSIHNSGATTAPTTIMLDDPKMATFHMSAPLAKRRHFNDNDDESCSDSSNDSELRNASEETYFIRLRVIGAYMPRQAADGTQSLHVAFVASPVVLRGLYSFGFGLGLSIMHCRRASWTDGVAASGKGMNLWNFLSKNKYPTAPKHFYNSKTVDFISMAKDFVVCYADHARPDPTMPSGLLDQQKIQLISQQSSLRQAEGGNQGFNSVLPNSVLSETQVSRGNHRQQVALAQPTQKPTFELISDPPDVYAQMPLGEDGRKRCLKFLSKPGCQFTKCSNAHFRPESLAEGVKNLISERWGGLSARYIDL
ncbi:hypothetical protein GN958_ATG13701, partial [Phytophthora infestans]